MFLEGEQTEEGAADVQGFEDDEDEDDEEEEENPEDMAP